MAQVSVTLFEVITVKLLEASCLKRLLLALIQNRFCSLRAASPLSHTREWQIPGFGSLTSLTEFCPAVVSSR